MLSSDSTGDGALLMFFFGSGYAPALAAHLEGECMAQPWLALMIIPRLVFGVYIRVYSRECMFQRNALLLEHVKSWEGTFAKEKAPKRTLFKRPLSWGKHARIHCVCSTPEVYVFLELGHKNSASCCETSLKFLKGATDGKSPQLTLG